MSYILNRIRLARLKVREWMLLAESSHTADLIADYSATYAAEIAELRKVRREIALRTAPDVLLNQVMRGKA